MLLYKFNQETKEYEGITYAQSDPKNPDGFLKKLNTTQKEPPEYNSGDKLFYIDNKWIIKVKPEVEENEIVLFDYNTQTWVIKPDYREKIYYKKDTKEKIIISEINVIPDETMTEIEPTGFEGYYIFDDDSDSWIIDQELYRAIKLAKLRTIRDSLITTTIWRMERHFGEREGIEKEITANPTSLTEEQFNQWLLYWETLRDIPQTINIDDYEIDDIVEANTEIFPFKPE